MYEAQHAKQTETDRTQTTATTQITARTKQGTQQTADLTRIPLYAQAWGNQLPRWLRLAAPRQTLIEQSVQQRGGAMAESFQENPSHDIQLLKVVPQEDDISSAAVQESAQAGISTPGSVLPY